MKPSCKIFRGQRPVQLSQAVLLYQNGDGVAMLTSHKVIDTNGTLMLAPGRVLGQDQLGRLLRTVTRQRPPAPSLIPEQVLSVGVNHLLWWLPAGKRTIFVRCPQLGQESAVLPHPPLVFLVVQRQWYVYALAENVRPSENTRLHHAPYMNLDQKGLICVGSSATPNSLEVKSITSWENAFFASAFTHLNGTGQRIRHPKGFFGLWRELFDQVPEQFPDCLLENGHTVANLLADLGQVQP